MNKKNEHVKQVAQANMAREMESLWAVAARAEVEHIMRGVMGASRSDDDGGEGVATDAIVRLTTMTAQCADVAALATSAITAILTAGADDDYREEMSRNVLDEQVRTVVVRMRNLSKRLTAIRRDIIDSGAKPGDDVTDILRKHGVE